MAFKEMNKEKD